VQLTDPGGLRAEAPQKWGVWGAEPPKKIQFLPYTLPKCRNIYKEILFLCLIVVPYYNQTKEENFLKKKWECIKNTNSPRLIRRYRIESKSKLKKKLFRTLKTLSNLTQKNYLPAN